MYAHHIIEYLKTDRVFPKKYVDSVASGIIEAETFYLGNSDDIHEVIKSVPKIFHGEKFLKMPYDNCLFEYDQNPDAITQGLATTKEAILIRRIFHSKGKDHLFSCSIVSYFPQYNRWRLSPIHYVISLNKWIDQSDIRALHEWGIPLDVMQGMGNLIPIGVIHADRDILIEEEHGARVNLTVAHKALMLLNCKNIMSQTVAPNEKLNKARRKRGKQEILSYKTLHLVVPRDKKPENGEHESLGEHNRIHFCRGHFKEYTEEAPLFGKFTGLYWWQPHVRGQNKDGVVLKNYEVEVK